MMVYGCSIIEETEIRKEPLRLASQRLCQTIDTTIIIVSIRPTVNLWGRYEQHLFLPKLYRDSSAVSMDFDIALFCVFITALLR